MLNRSRKLVYALAIVLLSLFHMNDAQAFYDCVVRPSASEIRIYDAQGRHVIGTLKAGSLLYTQYRAEAYPWGALEVYRLVGRAFKSQGTVDPKVLECDGQQKDQDYPIVLRNDEELSKAFGISADFDQSDHIKHQSNRCFHEGSADLDLSISDAFFAPYRDQGFSLDVLCIALKSGNQLRFDPGSGKRLPTYVRLGVAFNGEYPLVIPSCFAHGTFKHRHAGPITFATLEPIGCQIKYHPWSGRLLEAAPAEALTRLFGFSVGGEAGAVDEDSKALQAEAASRVLTPAKIELIKQAMKMK